ncbi:MAG: hypothetical protein HKM02_05225 [Pseudomonadales bacterium]|nr:hypothetical protein [Pseudomonadales bacterium]
MSDYRQVIMTQVLTDCRARHVLCLNAEARALLQNLPKELHPLSLRQHRAGEFKERADLALLYGRPTGQSDTALRQLLAEARDLLARHVLIFLNEADSQLIHPDALGYTQLAQHDSGMCVWTFDILTYKQVPDWLNARFWANPENWGHYRW